MSDRPIDHSEREFAKNQTNVNISLEAGAGTGKTTVLIDRYLELIKSGIPIEEIAAITFTVKAAREMSWRIREKLEQLRDESTRGIGREYIENALINFNKATIKTIHSFALSMLKERPFEASVDPELVIGELENDEIDTLFRRWLASLSEDEVAVLSKAIKTGLSVDNLKNTLKILLDSLDLLPAIEEEEQPPQVIPLIKEKIEETDEIVNNQLKGSTDDKLYKNFLNLKEAVDSLECDDNLVSLLDIKIKQNLGIAPNWKDKQFVLNTINDAKSYIDSQVNVWCSWVSNRLLLSIVRLINMIYERKRELSILTYDDILIKARDLIRNNPEVRNYFRKKYRYLLIDEFQDTDPLQVEIAYLIAGSGDSTDWQSTKLRDGSIFIVGDPKQSIYHFRRADLPTYRHAEDILVGQGEKKMLYSNFRSTPTIINWVNKTFSEIIGEAGDEHIDPPYTPIRAHISDETHIKHSSIVFLLPKIEDVCELKRVDEFREVEANYIASTINKIVSNGWKIRTEDGVRSISYGDIAILYMANTQNTIYEQAMLNYNIPYAFINADHILEETHEIRGLKTILEAIRNPYDDLAVLGALRSSFFAISDEEIVDYYIHHGKPDITREIHSNGHISIALNILHSLHSNFINRPIYELIDEITASTNLFLRTPILRKDRLVNSLMELIKSTAIEKTEDSTFTLRTLINHIDNLKADNEKKTINLYDPHENTVKLMTIHQAKGLEFPVVILAKLCSGKPRGGPGNVIKDFLGRRIEVKFTKTIKTSGYDSLAEKEGLIEDAENRRLIYVACTRARDYLIIPLITSPEKDMVLSGQYEYFKDKLPSPQEVYENNHLGKVVDNCYYIDPCELEMKEREPRSDLMKILKMNEPTEEYEKERSELVKERQSFLNREESISMALMTPTGIEEFEKYRSDEEMEKAGIPKKREVGRLVHEIMEKVKLDGSNINELTELICEYEDEKTRENIKEMVARILSMPVIERNRETARFIREMPFTYQYDNGQIVSGRIDLVIIDNDELIIVDYKTDSIKEGEWKKRAEDVYKEQMLTYRDAIEASTGKRVREIYLLNPFYGEYRIDQE